MIDAHLLTDNLNQIGVHFLVDAGYPLMRKPFIPSELLAGLASQIDARLRLSLIAVFLQQPDYSNDVYKALEILDEQYRPILMLYYTAAHFLQIIYADQLQDVLGQSSMLPDYFSDKLKISRIGLPTKQLKQLAKRHQEITGLALNWYGTYNHAAQRVITRLEAERTWNMV